MSYSPLEIVNYNGTPGAAEVTLDNLRFRYNPLTTVFELATVSGSEAVTVFAELSAAGVTLPSVSLPLVLTATFIPVGTGLLLTVGSALRKFTVTSITDERRFEITAHSASAMRMSLTMRLV